MMPPSGVLVVEREDAVPAGGAAHRALGRPAAGDPHRDTGALDRRGQEGGLLDGVVLAVVGERLAAPQPGEDVQRLVEHVGAGARVALVAEGDELVLGLRPRPAPKIRRPPQSRSSVAVSRATLAGRRRDSGVTITPSLIALRGHGDRGQRDPRVDRRPARVAVLQVVPEEEAVPARRSARPARSTRTPTSPVASALGTPTAHRTSSPTATYAVTVETDLPAIAAACSIFAANGGEVARPTAAAGRRRWPPRDSGGPRR